VLYPHGLTREIQLVLGAVVVLLNVGVYWVVWRRGLRAES
jgi:type II secretory pathway component PulM